MNYRLMKTERIYLKKLSIDDINQHYISWLNDPEVCKFNSHGEIEYTKHKAMKFVASLQNDITKEVWAVFLTQGGKHIGNISLQQIDYKNKKAEIAFLFGEKQYWRQGYATEASEVLLARAFYDLNLHRIYLGTHAGNTAMQKLAIKLGFSQEGIKREDQFKNGQYNDVIIYGLLKARK